MSDFINVDLDVQTSGDITPLVGALESKLDVLHTEGGFARFELRTGRRQLSLDTVLRGLLTLVEGLPPEARAVWDRCETRHFHAGFQAGPARADGSVPNFAVSPQTMQRMAALGGEFRITIYPPDTPEEMEERERQWRERLAKFRAEHGFDWGVGPE